MAVVFQVFNGGTDNSGTLGAITVSNSGLSNNGQAFTSVVTPSGSLNYVNLAAASPDASLSAQLTNVSGTSTYMSWTVTASGAIALHAYVYLHTLPSTLTRIIDIRNSTGTILRAQCSATNTLDIQEGGGSTSLTSLGSLSAATLYRIEMLITNISGTTGSYKTDYYLGYNTSPVNPGVSKTNGNLGTTNITQLIFGQNNNPATNMVMNYDGLAYNLGASAYIGPPTTSGISLLPATDLADAAPPSELIAYTETVQAEALADAIVLGINTPTTNFNYALTPATDLSDATVLSLPIPLQSANVALPTGSSVSVAPLEQVFTDQVLPDIEGNLVFNPGTELDTIAGGLYYGVQPYFGAPLFIDGTNSYDGEQSLQVVTNSAVNPQGIIVWGSPGAQPSGQLVLAAGTLIRASTWFLGPNGTSFTASYRTGSPAHEGMNAVVFTATGVWQKITLADFTLTDTIDTGVGFQVRLTTAATGVTFNVDEEYLAIVSQLPAALVGTSISTAPLDNVVIALPAKAPTYDLRIYHSDGVTYDLLVDYQSFTWQDSFSDAGFGDLEYPANGKSFALLTQHAEVGFCLNGTEVGRFFVEDIQGNYATDGANIFEFSGRSTMALLERAEVYPSAWPSPIPADHEFVQATIGTIFATLMTRAQARGTLPQIDFSSFTGVVDSSGVPWAKVLSLTFSAGTNYLQLLQNLVTNGSVDARMVGHKLYLYNQGGLAQHHPDTYVIRTGKSVTEATVHTTTRDIGTVQLVAGDNNTFVEAIDTTAITSFGRIEKYTSHGGIGDLGTLTLLSGYDVAQTKDIQNEFTTGYALQQGLVPYFDYQVGDYIWYDATGSQSSYRVQQITIAIDANASAIIGVTLNDLLYDRDVSLQRAVNQITSAASGQSTGPQPNPGIDLIPPGQPQGADFVSYAYTDPSSGNTEAQVSVTWVAPELSADGTALDDLRGYIAEWHYVASETNQGNELLQLDSKFENNSLGTWVSFQANLSVQATFVHTGSGALQGFTTVGGTVLTQTGIAYYDIKYTNRLYSGFAYLMLTATHPCRVNLVWYDAAGNFISSSTGPLTILPAGIWTKLAVDPTAPPTAAFYSLEVEIQGMSASELYYIDDAAVYPDNWNAIGFTTNEFISFSPINPGTLVECRVAAVDSSNNVSDFDVTPQRFTGKDITPPNQPSAPTLVPFIDALVATWDGFDLNGDPEAPDLSHVEVHVSPGDNFTPSALTLFDSITVSSGGSSNITGLTNGGTYYVRFVAVDFSGNKSTASVEAVGVPIGVNTPDIANGAITTALINDGAITAAKTALASISPADGSLTAGSVTALQIVAGSITALQIQAGGISTQNLSVAALSDNGIPNGVFEDNDTTSGRPTQWTYDWDVTSSGATYGTTPIAGSQSLTLTTLSAASGSSVASAAIPVTAGEFWVVSSLVKGSSTTNAKISVRVLYGTNQNFNLGTGLLGISPTAAAYCQVTDSTGATTSQTSAIGTSFTDILHNWVPATTGVYTSSGQVQIPTGATWMRIVCYANPSAGAGAYTATFDNVSARKLIGTAEIVNASILAAQIGTVSANSIIAGTITADVILGASFKTATSGGRVEVGLNGIKAFNSGGTQTVGIAIDGSMFASNGTFSGTITASIITGATISGGTITGTTVTGGTLQTAASGKRVEMDSVLNYINFYSGDSSEAVGGQANITSFPISGGLTMAINGPQLSGFTADNATIYLSSYDSTFIAPQVQISAVGAGTDNNAGFVFITAGVNSIWTFQTKDAGTNNNQFMSNNNVGLKMISSGTPTIQSRNNSDTSYGVFGASAFNVASSEKFKAGVEDWSVDALYHVRNTKITKYKRIIDHDEDTGTPILSEKHAFGPILEQMPEFLKAEHDTYDMASTIGLLWKAVQELEEEVRELRNGKQDVAIDG